MKYLDTFREWLAVLALLLLLPVGRTALAQTPGVRIRARAPDASAALQVSSGSKGFLSPPHDA